MKNKLIPFILFLLPVLPLYAQFKKGDSFGNIGLSGYYRASQINNQGTTVYDYYRNYGLSASLGAERFIHPKISLIYGGGLNWGKQKESTNTNGGTISSNNTLGMNIKLGVNHYHPILPKLLVLAGLEASLGGELIWRDYDLKNFTDGPRQNYNSLTQSFSVYAGLVSPLNEDVLVFLKVPMYTLTQRNNYSNGIHGFTSGSNLIMQGGLLFRLSTLKSMLKKKNGNN